TNQPYYYDGTAWKIFSSGGADKAVAAKIVAAVNSLDTARADYVCDGTDDQQELQQAINDLATIGGAVYLLEGTYNISGSINLDNTAPDDSGKAIIGTGKGTVLKIVSGASAVNVINGSNVNRILVSQLMIDGNNQTGANNTGIYFDSVTDSKIDNVWIKQMSKYGIYLDFSRNNTISGNNVQNSANGGIWLYSSSNNNTISGNNLQNNYTGIYLISSSNNTLSGNSVYGGNGYTIRLYSSSNNNTVSGNSVDGGTSCSVHIDFSNNNIISGNSVWRSGGNGILMGGSNNNTLSGNNLYSNALNGIRVDSSSSNTISGNSINSNGLGGAYDGIRIENNSDTNIFSSNSIFDTAGSGYGIEISDANCDNNYLAGNYINGAGFTDKISDSATNTKYTDKTKITLEPGSGYTGLANGKTLTPRGPTSYLRLVPTANVILGNPNIADGISAGDILILENTTAFTINFKDDRNIQLHKKIGFLGLRENDILTLIWNGTDWVEIGYSDN
ncbi:MAG: right-handed parallel beta-helix repeat-containing protein, partial [Elusimicrobia bacterium]|nr:right-handed parallel beta-helix repeat-containing protein [Elusimicrobiota bacterium]